MLPHEREMVSRMKDKPFVLLGINSDQSRSALKKIMKDEEITWPNIYDGSPGKGEIGKSWNVHAWPTIYVIDAKGVIRDRNLRDEQLAARVRELVKEAKAAARAAKDE